jgi:hypothetical protein
MLADSAKGDHWIHLSHRRFSTVTREVVVLGQI